MPEPEGDSSLPPPPFERPSSTSLAIVRGIKAVYISAVLVTL